MATLTQSYEPRLARMIFIRKRDKFIERLIPRRCMVISVGLIIAGWSIPALMAFQLLPATLFLCFVAFALVVTHGVLALILCGEI